MWALRLHPATPGLGARRGCACLGSGFSCTPPLLGCAGVGPPLAARHSWLGCAPWVCMFGLGFRLHPATPGVCRCGRSACNPPLLSWVCAVSVCVWARVSAARCLSWRVLVWALRLHPATPGLGARCGCVCLGSGFGCFLWCAVVRCWGWWPVVVCWCRTVAPCCPFSFAGGVGLCLFPVCAVLCCAVRRVIRFRLSLRCCWCLVLWRVPVCCGVSLGVLRCGGPALVCRGVLLCCALSCGVLRPVLCPAVLRCLAVLCWWAVLCGCLRCWCLFFLLSSFPLLKPPAVFPCL